MGFRPAALTLLLPLLAPPALAQEQQSGGEPVFNLPKTTQTPPVDPNRQGPELDVFRGAPTPVTPPPPIIAPPTITAPAPTVPEATPQAQPPAANRTPRPAAPPPRPQPVPAPAPEADTNAPLASPEQPAQPQAQPDSAYPAAQPAAPSPPATAAPVADTNPWLWIFGGLLAIAAALGVLWLRRRRPSRSEEALDALDEAEPAPTPAPPTPRAAPIPAPAKPGLPPPRPAPPPAAPAAAERPWIDLAMDVRSARLSLMGATINYVLTLHNRGSRPAEDLLIRSLITNADAGQQPLLQQFFAGSVGLPIHSVVSVAPGERQSLIGELRLLPDQIAPVQMDGRALLVPLVAFDAQYRWNEDGNPVGTGRTGRAFIVGQEQSPPADRLAPFRLDLGPRQYRTPGSRATALELAS